MNEIETLVSFAGTLTSDVDQIKYIFSDEYFDLINFADQNWDSVQEFLETYSYAFDEDGNLDLDLLTQQEINTWATLSSISAYHIELDAVSYNEFELNLISPTKITFNPYLLNTQNKIYKIEYIFDFYNNTSPYTQTFFYKPTSIDSLNLPYSSEPGDPRNFTASHVYSLVDELSTTKYALVKIYEFGKVSPSEILYTLNIRTVNPDGPDGLFNEIHLISNKMFDSDDKLLYVFESYNPQYLLPVVVKWDDEETVFVKRQKFKRINLKPYKILSPFEIPTDENQNIEAINFVPSNSYSIDEGYRQTHNIITRDTNYYIKTSDGKYIRIGNYYNSNLNLPQPPLPTDTRWITDDREFIITEDGENIWL